jgi:transposase
MAAGRRYDIVLDPDTAAHLRRVAGSRTAPVREVRRAQVLLARSAREAIRDLCARLRCATGFVTKVCRRFCEGGWAEARRERPRGRPRRRDPAEREAVVEAAQTPPQRLGHPVTRWTLEQFRVHLAETRPDQPPPSRSTLQRWLAAADLPWWRTRSWCTSDDPDFALKERLVCDAYCHAPPPWAVLCYDQAPHLQALSRRVARRPCRRGKPGRREHDYRRRGTVDLHALLDVRTGVCQARVTWRHDGATIAGVLWRWLAARPETHLILICDNLSANHAPLVEQALARLGKVVLVFRTPTHSSWLNQVERVFADLGRQLLDLLECDRPWQLGLAIQRWFRARNRRATPYRWRYHPDSRLSGKGH